MVKFAGAAYFLFPSYNNNNNFNLFQKGAGTFHKNDLFAQNGQNRVLQGPRGASEQNINSCLKWSKRVQMGPKGSQMIKNT